MDQYRVEATPPHLILPPDDELRRIPIPLWSPSNCIVCSGTRAFMWWNADRSKPVEWECDCEDQFVLGVYLLSRGLLMKQMRTGWADLVGLPPQGVQWCQTYLAKAEAFAKRGIGAVLMGDSGVGKSTLAHLMLRTLMAAGMDGYWVTYPSLVQLVKDGWTDKETNSWFDRRVRNAPVLVVDQLGKEHSSQPFAASLLDDVLRHRLSSMMPTFITTNLREPELQQRYGAAVVEVIHEASSLCVINGESWRAAESGRAQAEAEMGLTRPIVMG